MVSMVNSKFARGVQIPQRRWYFYDNDGTVSLLVIALWRPIDAERAIVAWPEVTP